MRLDRYLKDFYRFLLPRCCEYCAALLYEDQYLCTACLHEIRPVVSYELSITPSKKMTVFAVGAYDGPLKKLILGKSYSYKRASVMLADLIWQHTPLQQLTLDCFVPIPLHWRRAAWRGYNQATELAKRLERQANVPVHHLLKRVVHRPYQSQLAPGLRKENVAGVFVATAESGQWRGKHIMLVDDVMTSGSTLLEAARVLRALEPASLRAVVAARTC